MQKNGGRTGWRLHHTFTTRPSGSSLLHSHSFSLCFFFLLLFQGINLTTDFSAELPLVVIIDQSLTENPYSFFTQSNLSRPHTAPFGWEIKTLVAHNGETLCYLKIGLSVFQLCISNHKVKDCFPFGPKAGSRTLCRNAAGLIFRVALNRINKMTFLSPICFMSGWTVAPLSLCFCLCSITGATGERQHLVLYAFYL